jgi:aconitate hydratase 2/2-methylisocitrate dehydratase
MAGDIYRYMNFDQIADFQSGAERGKQIAAVEIVEA